MSAQPEPAAGGDFQVHLEVFEGPFDLLLTLIAKHQLDVTEVALSRVTDEFIAHIRAAGPSWDLGQATEFLVVAATLLDLKTARLLPAGQVEDEEDIAALEARDLLFARLLQYRAYQQAAGLLGALLAVERRRWPREVALEPAFAAALPEVRLGRSATELAELAVRALAPRQPPVIALDHVHAPQVSVAEHTAVLRSRLAHGAGGSFRALTADCASTIEVVARFLALLELFREGLVAFEQVTALGDLHVRWASGRAGASDAGPAVEDAAAAAERPDELVEAQS